MPTDSVRVTMRTVLCALVLWACCLPVHAQQAGREPPGTGDAWIDDVLLDIDRYADKHRGAFVDELVRYQAVPRALVEESFSEELAAGDVYYACAMAQALGRPCRELLEARRGAESESWATIVRRIDAAQMSTAQRRVKAGLVGSYARWARPLAPAEVTRSGAVPPKR